MQDEHGNEPGWVFKPGTSEASSPNVGSETPDLVNASHSDSSVSWSASEYVANPKNISWFSMLGIATGLIAVVVYLITKDLVSTIVIVVLGIVVGIFAARQPQTLEYNISEQGIQIGPKGYPYESFRSFSVAQEGGISFVSLAPLKRFMPPITIHYAPDDEEKILTALSSYLPFEEHKRDIVDSFSRRLRF